jgi:hypothetical protein
LSLRVTLQRPLPSSLPPASATAIFVSGTCSAERRLVSLTVTVDGERHAVSAFGMPRDERFWAIVPVPASGAEETVVGLAAELEDAGRADAELGRIERRAPEQRRDSAAGHAAPESGGELIAVCMATYEPDRALLGAQIESLRAQTDERWICLISDDGSSRKAFDSIAELVGGDPRFELSRSEQRLGFYRNFERALAMAPADAALLALCDQDDRWHPDKLATLREAIGDAGLVYSDLRLVDRDGTVLRETLWRGRRNNHDDLVSMLVANTITGAATLFRRELLELLLPFPDSPGFQFHDAWLATTALAAGEVAYVERPLYDYVQHAGAVFGDVTHGPRRTRLRLPDGPLAWRAAYFHGYLSRAAQAQVLLERCGDRLTARKRAALLRFLACDRSAPATAWLALRSLRLLGGRTETLGSELGLARGLAWKLAISALAGGGVTVPGTFGDAAIPPPQHFSQRRLRRWRARV